jgi:hypothetical protein
MKKPNFSLTAQVRGYKQVLFCALFLPFQGGTTQQFEHK